MDVLSACCVLLLLVSEKNMNATLNIPNNAILIAFKFQGDCDCECRGHKVALIIHIYIMDLCVCITVGIIVEPLSKSC